MLWKPNCINEALASQPKLWLGCLPESIKIVIRERASIGWRFFPVSQDRGRCYYEFKVITIPMFAIQNKKIGYFEWYISHELAHTFAIGDSHGPKFMAELMRICPPQYVHHEIGYKPRNAIAAGIRKPLEDL